MEQYEKLRREYPRFYYHGYEAEWGEEALNITYTFEIEGLSVFTPRWTFPLPHGRQEEIKSRVTEEMLFSLGMVELISYWKIACPPQVYIEKGKLDSDQIQWWKHLYFNGLGEFFYVNGIEEAREEDFMEIHCQDSQPEENPSKEDSAAGTAKTAREKSCSGGFLVPIGGGKDSAVTLDILKDGGYPVYGYIINPRGASLNTAERAGLSEGQVMKVKRTLDGRMLELNRQGYLNGHTPFSALVAFSSLIGAAILDLDYVALSNESSANESTVPGSSVNHQYSKSFEFEKDFHQYAGRYLPGSAYYFSLLRPLSEFQIAWIFSGLKQYHDIFRSCNSGSKTDSWCGHCPKCLFVCLILSPFLGQEELEKIFGRAMLEDLSLRETFDKLVGIASEKPFECVGSRNEVREAARLTIEKLEGKGEKLPVILEYYRNSELFRKEGQRGESPYFTCYDEDNLLPKELDELVRQRIRREKR